ncbi:MAG: Ig-like domain-containing protein [Pseudomonadales bacterium]|nr:Ig-like domain-containing protein [Pseudomonadales bacterium]
MFKYTVSVLMLFGMALVSGCEEFSNTDATDNNLSAGGGSSGQTTNELAGDQQVDGQPTQTADATDDSLSADQSAEQTADESVTAQSFTETAENAIEIVNSRSLSQHFVQVELDGPADPSALDLLEFAIISGTGESLEVKKVVPANGGAELILETQAQDPILYTVTMKSVASTGLSAQRSAARDTTTTEPFVAPSTIADASDFIGTSGPEPIVLTVTALSSTSVLVTMDGLIDKEFAENISAYRILAPDYSIPNEDEGRIQVTSATLNVDPRGHHLITLTTTPLNDIEYQLVITNIVSSAGSFLIHPDRNSGTFFGIAPTDITGPRLMSAVSTSHTGVLATFSEPLSNDAAEPIHYQLCSIAFDIDGNCPQANQLAVNESQLVGLRTQVALTSGPQNSGSNYFLSVIDVTDRATPAPGNVIAVPTVAQFTGSGLGAPQIESTISIDNTHLLVTFTERMSDDVLDPLHYRIESPSLDVINAVFGDDVRHVVLTTSPQERREYQLVVGNIRSAEGRLTAIPSTPSLFVGFAAKDIQKPTLIASIAETSSRIRLYFSEPLAVNAVLPSNYDISYCPEFETCTTSTLSTLPVLSATLAESQTQVLLTTENIAPRVLHEVIVSEQVTDQATPLPHNGIDSSFDTGTFGLLLADKIAPSLAGLTIIGPTNITLTFSEAVDESAANPLHYLLCNQAFNIDGSCTAGSEIQVLDTSLNASSTQVTLTTAPLTAGTEYFVQLTPGVTDTSGNIIVTAGNSGNVVYAGATSVADPFSLPKVVGAIATSNNRVTLSFSSVMGDSALLAENYVFAQENVNAEVGTVFTLDVSWFDDAHTAIVLSTTAQNEVTYRVTAVNVKDNLGNPLDTPKLVNGSTFDPSSAVFAGSPPIAQNLLLTAGNAEFLDLNDDGLQGVGDAFIIDGISLLLTDIDLDGSVDNWQDTNTNGVIDAGDFISGLIDSDSDGLADNEELRGTIVEITMTNGQVVSREVTSDPTLLDTDRDGLTDAEELDYGTDPRSADTDADGINDYVEWNVIFSDPSSQDSDGDGLGDGSEHNFFRTSPILADTDGDQFDDAEELVSLNRNPKVADLPEIDIHVGEINLQIDERYTYVNSKGDVISSESSTSTSLSSSDNTSFSNSIMTMDEASSGFSASAGFGIRDAQFEPKSIRGAILNRIYAEVEIGGHFERTTGTTIQIDQASATESQQALENSLTRANEASEGSEVTRELLAARISANITVENIGNLALTVKNLQVSVSQIDPQNVNKLLPIATLVAESGSLTGEGLEINLGPFDQAKGPFIFTNTELFPNLVETLMRNPTSLVFKVVNYDIVDEYERNFAFASQLARDRTSGITFDFGELGSESYYVATSGVLDGQVYQGGFDDVGKPRGLPLGYLLETILDIPKHDTEQDYIDAGVDGVLETSPAGDDVSALVDGLQVIMTGNNGILETIPAGDDRLRNDRVKTGIIAGADKRVDSIAQGDDVQLVPFGTTGVAPKSLVIDAGNNGVLESGRSGDDIQEFISGYEVQSTCSIASTDEDLVGYFCSESLNGCSCDGPKGLVRVNTFRNGDFGNTWFARFSGDLPAAVDFDQIQLRPGEDIRLAFLQDLDKDGLFAHEEFLFGSTDSSVNKYDNNQFRPIVVDQHYTAKTPAQLAADSVLIDTFADSMDTDRDGIGDFAEARLGWLISRNGELKRVFSSPARADSDNDGLWDIQEQDLREFCRNTATGADPRQDALCKPVVVNKVEATGIIVGINGRLDTFKGGDDEYALFIPKNNDADPSTPDQDDRFNRSLMFAAVAILPGPNGLIDTDLVGDDEYINASVTLPATDPVQSDTDLDGVSDGDELFGYAVGMGIIEGAETECNNVGTVCQPNIRWGIANTRAQGDDVQRIYPGSRTRIGEMIVSAGPNGILETTPEGDDKNIGSRYVAAGADRVLNCEASDDVDNRQVFGANESFALDPFAPGVWNVNGGDPVIVDESCFVTALSDDIAGKDLALYGTVVVTDPLRRDTDTDLIPDGFEIAIGANPTVIDGDSFRDSDFDGLTDEQETQGWVVAVNGGVGRLIRSNATLPDSDFDGLPDYVERDIGASPNVRDTDNDGLDDYAEFRSVARLQEDGTTRVYSAFDYTFLPNVFSGFSLVVNPTAHNTDPTNADSDGDRLSDFAELVSGYQIKVTGQSFLGPVIFTDPNNVDSDGDGLVDYEEAIGINNAQGDNYITNASSADTDGDGTADDVELRGGLTNPLVPDAMFKVNYESVYISSLDGCSFAIPNPDAEPDSATDAGCPDKTNVLWWLYASGNDGVVRGKHLISSSDEFAYTPEGSVRALAAGHSSLVGDDSSFNGALDDALDASEIPDSASKVPGLKMQAQRCGNQVNAGTDCDPLFTVNVGDTGYNDNVNINFGGGGIPGAENRFRVKWTGEILIEESGVHEFFVQSDDGVRIFIDDSDTSLLNLFGTETTDLSPAADSQIWANHNTLSVHGVITLSEGWHKIEVDYYDWSLGADIKVEWTTPTILAKTILPRSSLRHPLGDGSYSCIALERDTKQSSYISLNRSVELDNLIEPAEFYTPGIAYYGGTRGSEMKIFRDVVAQDSHPLDTADIDDAPFSRYYLDLASPVLDVKGVPLLVEDLVATALDLAASRSIINNLVRPDVARNSIATSTEIKVDEFGDRYFELSEAGKMLYQQLQAEALYGQQSFVVKEGESIELSGMLMKVDDLQKLTACPIGASGVVSQFGSGCTKRFSRTISYADIQQQPFMTLNLSDLKTQTYTSSGSGGCDIDITTTIRLGR